MNYVTVSHIMLICAHSTGGSGTLALKCPPLHQELLQQLGIALHRVYHSEFTHPVFIFQGFDLSISYGSILERFLVLDDSDPLAPQQSWEAMTGMVHNYT